MHSDESGGPAGHTIVIAVIGGLLCLFVATIWWCTMRQAQPSKFVIITSWAGVGKTTTGEYLGKYCKFSHIDGDNIKRTPFPETKNASDGLTKSFTAYWCRDQMAPPELWRPYLNILCGQCLEAAKTNNCIVLSFSVHRREVRDFLRERLGRGVLFLKLECDVDVVVGSAIERIAEFMSLDDKTVEDWWAGPQSLVDGRSWLEEYGEYSYDGFKRMQLEHHLSGMEAFAEDEKDYVSVDASSRDMNVLDRVHEVLGLGSRTADVDFDKLEGIQTARRKKLDKSSKAAGPDTPLALCDRTPLTPRFQNSAQALAAGSALAIQDSSHTLAAGGESTVNMIAPTVAESSHTFAAGGEAIGSSTAPAVADSSLTFAADTFAAGGAAAMRPLQVVAPTVEDASLSGAAGGAWAVMNDFTVAPTSQSSSHTPAAHLLGNEAFDTSAFDNDFALEPRFHSSSQAPEPAVASANGTVNIYPEANLIGNRFYPEASIHVERAQHRRNTL